VTDLEHAAGLLRETREILDADPLEQLVRVFRHWLHLPDLGPLYAVLGAVAANRLAGDPCWLLLIGAPGSGKSELLGAVSRLSDSHPAATLTEASLLSGTPKKEHADGAKGGLLRVIGTFGNIVAKDFGSVLNMNRDARAATLAALREVYDGSWTRHVGTDGGRTLTWAGKVGFVGGCTPTIDRHHAVMGAMGERFVLYRLPPVDPRIQARRALEHAGRETAMRQELAAAVSTLFATRPDRPPRALTEDETDRLVTLAALVVRCRSAVERDGYQRDIELVPEPEAPTRLVVVLSQLLAGLDAIGVPRTDAWHVVTKAGLDSVPALRLAVLRELHAQPFAVETGAVGEALGYPTTTARRALEDLAAHGLAIREPQGKGKADRWSLADFARDALKSINEGCSRKVVVNAEREIKSKDTASDISGTVGDEPEDEALWASRYASEPEEIEA
jgi:hypothetical protein